MTQEALEAMKVKAHQIGRWAQYLLTEREYWNPEGLETLTEEELQEAEASNREWLRENRSQYPASGAEEVLRQELTEWEKMQPTSLDEDTACEMEHARQEGTPLPQLMELLTNLRQKAANPPEETGMWLEDEETETTG